MGGGGEERGGPGRGRGRGSGLPGRLPRLPPSLHGRAGGRGEDVVRFDAFTSPFSPQSASSTLAALSKKVSERSHASSTGGGGGGGGAVSAGADHQTSASSFLSLVSMTSSAALLKEVAARAAGNLLAEKKEGSPVPSTGLLQEDVKPLLDRNQKPPTPSTPTQGLDLLLPFTPKGRGKSSSQAGNLTHLNSRGCYLSIH